LLQGKHTIFFSALDGNGKWSREVTATIDVIVPVVPDEPEPPVIPVTPSAPTMLFMPVIGH
jgi:hypothetical protein